MAPSTDLIQLASPFEEFIELIAPNAEALSTLELQAILEAGTPYRVATDNITKYTAQIIRNNPGKDITQILARADVQQRMAQLSAKASEALHATVNGGHTQGWKAGSSHARKEAASLGLKTGPAIPPYTSSSHLASILDDADIIASDFSPKVQMAMADGFNSVQGYDPKAANQPLDLAQRRALEATKQGTKAGSRIANRASAAASTVTSRSYNQAQLEQMAQLQSYNPGVVIKKVWVCSLSANTCGTCAALHGTVLDLDVEFDHTQTFVAGSPPAVYGDLPHPPRHPACACRIAIYTESFGDDAAAMRKKAQTFAANHKHMAPRSWASGSVSNIAQSSDFMTASDIRAISDARFENSMRAFRSCVLGGLIE